MGKRPSARKIRWAWHTTGLLRTLVPVTLVTLVFLLSGLYSILFDLPHGIAIAVLVIAVLIFVGKVILG